MKQLIEFFRDKQANAVLDVGTGTGSFLEVLRQVFPGAAFTGVDPDSASLEEAVKNYPDVSFREMTAGNLGFPVNSFDAAAISMALHHLPDISKSLAEMRRVVKPNGWIIVNEPFSDNLTPAQESNKLYHHFKSTIDRLLGVTHNETFKKEEILQMVKNSGIQIQLHFESKKSKNLVAEPKGLESRIESMKGMLLKIKDFPEYEKLKPQIEQFQSHALKYGFEMATKVVIAGQNK